MCDTCVSQLIINSEYKLLEHDNKFNQVFNELQNNKELYHCGASLKDLGKKCFGINKIDGMNFIENILDRFNEKH